jgi:hypothetical protein
MIALRTIMDRAADGEGGPDSDIGSTFDRLVREGSWVELIAVGGCHLTSFEADFRGPQPLGEDLNLFWGAGVFVLPVIAIYTATVYWVFRGKLRQGDSVSPGTAPTEEL